MDLEKLATSAVTQSISKTQRLSSFINSGDKEPAWDGNIYIHKDGRKTKIDIKKVSTQVKGKAVKGKCPLSIDYRIDTVDLQAYLSNGGTMFFVVYLDSQSGDTKQIYYASLLPFKIIEILKVKNPTQKSFKVKFNRFPEDNYDKTDLFLNHYNNAQCQISFVGKDIPTLDELKKREDFEGLVIRYTQSNHTDAKPIEEVIIGKELYVYAKIAGNPAEIPVQHIYEISEFNSIKEVQAPVLVDGRAFYSSYQIISSSDKLSLKIGRCITFETIKHCDQQEIIPVNCTIQIQGTLSERIVALDFLLSAAAQKEFYLGEYKYPFEFPEEEMKKLGTDEYPKMLEGYLRAKKTLDTLRVKKDLNLDECTEQDFSKLNSLIHAIESNKPIRSSKTNLPIIININIANIRIAMICRHKENGVYNIWDFFSTELPVIYKDQNGNRLPISQFAIMKKTDFITLDNLCYEYILKDYQKFGMKDYIADSANNFMLEMLKAYDETSDVDLMNAIKAFSNWLQANAKFLPNEIVILNSLQIIKRERALTYAEKDILHNIIRRTKDDFFRLGAFILLDEKQESQKIMDSFTEEQLKTFTAFPIYRFYKEA